MIPLGRAGRVGPLGLVGRVGVVGLVGVVGVAGAQTPPLPPQGPPGTVTLPLAEYNRLLDRASAPAIAPDAPPLPAVVSRADLQIQAATAGIRANITLTGEVFRNGPTKVP